MYTIIILRAHMIRAFGRGIEGWINLIREEPLMIHFWNEYRGTDGPEYREYMDSSLTQSNFD